MKIVNYYNEPFDPEIPRVYCDECKYHRKASEEERAEYMRSISNICTNPNIEVWEAKSSITRPKRVDAVKKNCSYLNRENDCSEFEKKGDKNA